MVPGVRALIRPRFLVAAAVAGVLHRVRGAYSLLLLTEDAIIAARDPYGFRPLVLGKVRDSYVVASETCALDLIEAEYVRDIDAGEIVVVDGDGLSSFHPFPPSGGRSCIFLSMISIAVPSSNGTRPASASKTVVASAY